MTITSLDELIALIRSTEPGSIEHVQAKDRFMEIVSLGLQPDDIAAYRVDNPNVKDDDDAAIQMAEGLVEVMLNAS